MDAVPTLIERDDKFPPLAELLAEVRRARTILETHDALAGRNPAAPVAADHRA